VLVFNKKFEQKFKLFYFETFSVNTIFISELKIIIIISNFKLKIYQYDKMYPILIWLYQINNSHFRSLIIKLSTQKPCWQRIAFNMKKNFGIYGTALAYS